LGSTLLHKTESRLVHLHLGDAEAVGHAAESISLQAGAALEGFLVQPMIAAKREFVAGMFRDPEYGPVIMFGLGGIFTEAFSDVVFRLAPLSPEDAGDMLDEIRSGALLDSFRGEAAADRAILVQTLTGISRAALENPEVAEIDINPLLITKDGSVVAVDALVVRGAAKKAKKAMPAVDPAVLGALFHPRSVAFVGASAQLGKWGYTLLTNTIGGGYPGPIYLVNPRGGEIAGRKVYERVTDIAGPVDVAVVTIPAAKVPELIGQFQQKGISYMPGKRAHGPKDNLWNWPAQPAFTLLAPIPWASVTPTSLFTAQAATCGPRRALWAWWLSRATWEISFWRLPSCRGSGFVLSADPETRA
jgi:hypothetical protein